MTNIFIGVDGGGTKTEIMVEDEAGQLIGHARSGAANIRTSISQTWHSIYTGVNAALAQAGIAIGDKHYQFHIGLGLAGTEDRIATQQFLAEPHPFTTLVLDSDAYTACLAAHAGKDGTIIIIGTGVIGYSLYQGKRFTVAGWGFPYSDKGCGAWLGMEAIRLVFRLMDEQVPKTPMLEAIYNHFNCDIHQIVSWSNLAGPTEFAKIAPFVIQHIEKNDPYALRLIQEAAEEIELIAETIEKKLPVSHASQPCALLGGIAPFIRPFLKPITQSRLVKGAYLAPKGAIFMIRNTCNSQKLFG